MNLKRRSGIFTELAAAKLMPGAEHIYVAGEKEYNAYEKRKVEGVPIPEVTQLEILSMKQDLGLNQYEFNFSVDPDQETQFRMVIPFFPNYLIGLNDSNQLYYSQKCLKFGRS